MQDKIIDQKTQYWAAGFMSGTSLDGVDAALIHTDGEQILDFGPAVSVEFSSEDRAALEATVAAARDWNWRETAAPNADNALEVLHKTHVSAFHALVQAAGFQPDLLGVHGQTLLHRAPVGASEGRTWQVFDAARYHVATQMPLVYDFRSDDVVAGGHGAPLAPAYHGALLAENLAESLTAPQAVLNLGGVANITWQGRDGALIACDTGPANGPIDEWVAGQGLGAYDKGGALAQKGTVDEARLAQWLSHPWFDAPPPKSLDRYDFSARLAEGLTPHDGAATLTAFSAACVARSFAHLPEPPARLIVCGGGRHNPVLMAQLRARLPCEVIAAEDIGWRGDSIEAEAFALLAVRHVRGLPLSWPLTTGVCRPMSGGRMMGRIQ